MRNRRSRINQTLFVSWTAIVIALGSLVVSIVAVRGTEPSLHVDDWKVHNRTEFGTRDKRDIEELSWGLTFSVRHAAGVPPPELTVVEVRARPPLVGRGLKSFEPETPNQVVSASTPYRSVLYNVPPEYTLKSDSITDRTVLLEVTITYVDRRMLGFGREYREMFCGKFSVGGIAGDRGWYIRAERWDKHSIHSCKVAEE